MTVSKLALEIHVLLHGGADDGRQARAKFGRECDTQHLTRVAFEHRRKELPTLGGRGQHVADERGPSGRIGALIAGIQ